MTVAIVAEHKVMLPTLYLQGELQLIPSLILTLNILNMYTNFFWCMFKWLSTEFYKIKDYNHLI